MFEEEAVKHYNNLTKSALRLNEIVKEQQQRIDKAIEYIENLENSEEINVYQEDKSWVYVLKILKGVQDERTTIE